MTGPQSPVSGVKSVRDLTEDEKVQLGIYHTMDHELARRQLRDDCLCGKVRVQQDRAIADAILGTRVLDVGSGYGTLTRKLRRRGLQVTALEPHKETRDLAREWFGVSSSAEDVYSVPLEPDTIDTAIFRESVEHLDMELTLARLAELGVKRVLIFQSNLNGKLRLTRWWLQHAEFNPKPRLYYEEALARHGFVVKSVTHRDVVAFPLSGGLLLKQRFPRIDAAEKLLVAVDDALARTFDAVGLGPVTCWRFLIVADHAKAAEHRG